MTLNQIHAPGRNRRAHSQQLMLNSSNRKKVHIWITSNTKFGIKLHTEVVLPHKWHVSLWEEASPNYATVLGPWPSTLLGGELAIVTACVIIAPPIIPRDTVLIWRAAPQVQVTVSTVVAVRLAVCR